MNVEYKFILPSANKRTSFLNIPPPKKNTSQARKTRSDFLRSSLGEKQPRGKKKDTDFVGASSYHEGFVGSEATE